MICVGVSANKFICARVCFERLLLLFIGIKIIALFEAVDTHYSLSNGHVHVDLVSVFVLSRVLLTLFH